MGENKGVTRITPDTAGGVGTGFVVNYPTQVQLAATNQTLTGAQMLSGIIEHAPTGAATDTTDTGANIDTAMPGVQVGDTFTFVLTNTSGGANTITLAGGTGVTLLGNLAVAQNKSAFVTLRRTGVGTWRGVSIVSA